MKLNFNFSNMADRILFLIQIDGLVHNRLAMMMDAGELPSLSSLLKDRPGTFGPVVTTFPSATAPSLPELFTGCWCDKFFKRPRKINAFDRVQRKALKYEFLPEAWDGDYYDIFNIFRMNGEIILNMFSGEFASASVTYHDNLYYGLDALGKFSGRETVSYDKKVVEKLIEFIALSDKPPRLVFLGLNSADLAGHFQGPGSPLYESSILEIDSHLGQLFSFLKEHKDNGIPLYDKSLFFIFGDHGMVDSNSFIDLVTNFKAEGIKISDLGSIAHLVAEKLNPFWMMDREVLSVPGGSNITELYIRKKRKERLLDWDNFPTYEEMREYPVQGWFQERAFDLIGFLLGMEGVGEVIASMYPGAALVHTPDRGEAVIYSRMTDASLPGQGLRIAYQPQDRDAIKDPFGYLSHPIATDMVCADNSMSVDNFYESRFDDHFFSIREWVRATRNSAYPGAAALIPKSFVRHHTTCDIIVNARKPFNFSKYFHGDHGTLEKDSVITSLLASGPGVKNGADLSNILWVDILPTLLELMRIGVPSTFRHSIDGAIYPELIDDLH